MFSAKDGVFLLIYLVSDQSLRVNGKNKTSETKLRATKQIARKKKEGNRSNQIIFTCSTNFPCYLAKIRSPASNPTPLKILHPSNLVSANLKNEVQRETEAFALFMKIFQVDALADMRSAHAVA